jgi:N-acyl-D-amino-acid deacylase
VTGLAGDSRSELVQKSAAEQADMRALLREAMEEGAWGLSTGLDYPPGSYADTAELVGLSQEAARLGGIYHSHVRYRLGDRFLDPFREAIEIGRRLGIPAHITHFYQRLNAPGSARDMLGLVEDAREREGLDVTLDSYPYVYSSTRLLIMFPDWVHTAGPSVSSMPWARPRRASACGATSRHAARAGRTSGSRTSNGPQPRVRGLLGGRSCRPAQAAPGRCRVRPPGRGRPASVVYRPEW